MDTRSKRKAGQQLTPPSSYATRPTTRRTRNLPSAATEDGNNEPQPAEPAASRPRSEPLATKARGTHSYGTRSRRRVIALNGADTVASQELTGGGRRDDQDGQDGSDGDDVPAAFAPLATAPAGARKRKAPVPGVLNAEPSPRRTRRGGGVPAGSAAVRPILERGEPNSSSSSRRRGLATRLRSRRQNQTVRSPIDLPRPPVARRGRRGRQGNRQTLVEEVEDSVQGDGDNHQAADVDEVEDSQDEDRRVEPELGREEEDQDGASESPEEVEDDDRSDEEEAEEEAEDANDLDREAREAGHLDESEQEVEDGDYEAEEDAPDDDDDDDEGDDAEEEDGDVETPDEDYRQAPRPRPASSMSRPAFSLPPSTPHHERRINLRASDAAYDVPSDHENEVMVDSIDGDAHSDLRPNELPLGSETRIALELELASISPGCIVKMTRLMGKEAWTGSGDSWPLMFSHVQEPSISRVRDLKDRLEALRSSLSRVPRNPDLIQQASFFRQHAPKFEVAMDAIQAIVETIVRYLRQGQRPIPLARDLMKTALPMGVLTLSGAFEVASLQPLGPGQRFVEFSVPMAAIVQRLADWLDGLLAAMRGVSTGNSDYEDRLHQKQRDLFQGLLAELQESLTRAKAQAAANMAEAAERQRLDRERESIEHEARLRAMERDERLRRIWQAQKEEIAAAKQRQYEAFARRCQRPQPSPLLRRTQQYAPSTTVARRSEPAASGPSGPSSSRTAGADRAAAWEYEPEQQEEWDPSYEEVEYIMQVLRGLGPGERFPLSDVAMELGRTAPEVSKWKGKVTDMAKTKYYEVGVHADQLPDWVFK